MVLANTDGKTEEWFNLYTSACCLFQNVSMNKIPIFKTCSLPKWLYFLCWTHSLLCLQKFIPRNQKKISYIFPVQAIAAQTDMTMRANNKNGTDHPDFSYTQVWWKRSCLMSYNPWQCISNETRKSSHFPLRLEANYKATSGCLNLLLSRKHPSSARENG